MNETHKTTQYGVHHYMGLSFSGYDSDLGPFDALEDAMAAS